MGKYWYVLVAACLILAGCSKNSVERSYPLSIEDTYAALTRLDLRDEGDLGFPTSNIEVDLVPLEMVTWRFMLGNLETGRMNARLSRQGDAETLVSIDIDTSQAPQTTGFAAEQDKIAKGWRLAFMTEKVASTLEGRRFDRDRVNAGVKDFKVDQTMQAMAMAGNLAESQARMRAGKGDSGLTAYGSAMEQEMRRNAPSDTKPTFAETQANKWRQDNQ